MSLYCLKLCLFPLQRNKKKKNNILSFRGMAYMYTSHLVANIWMFQMTFVEMLIRVRYIHRDTFGLVSTGFALL